MGRVDLRGVGAIPFAVIGITIGVVILVSMLQPLETNLNALVNVNTNNTLIENMRPVLPYLTGLVVLGIIFALVYSAIKNLDLK